MYCPICVKFAKRYLNKLLVSICDFRDNWLKEDRTFHVGINEVNWHVYRETAWRFESKDSLDNIRGRMWGVMERPASVTVDNVLHLW
jgi:hypothetical protein